MKELSIEEKAKLYDEAMKVAIVAHKDEDRHLKATLERIFPELKEESEDERIRKALITFFQRFPYTNLYDEGLNAKDVLAWLEKQGEQKPNDKVDLDEDVDRILEENDWDYDEIDFYEFAKHFYELGFKAQKGE